MGIRPFRFLSGEMSTSPVSLGLLLFVLIPLVVALAWGGLYEDVAYQRFNQARSLANGDVSIWEARSVSLDFSTYILIQAWMSKAGFSISETSLALSVLGWMLAVACWGLVGISLKKPFFALGAAGLLALHPLQAQVWGLETGLILGLLSVATFCAVKNHPWRAGIVLTLLILLQPVGLLFGLPLILIALRWVRRVPVFSELFFLFAAWILLFLAAVFLFGASLDSPVMLPLFLAILLLLGAAIAEWILSGLRFQGPTSFRMRGFLQVFVVLLVTLLILFEGMSLVRSWHLRPATRPSSYRTLAAYLQEHVPVTKMVAAQGAAMLDYYADHEVISLSNPFDADSLVSELASVKPAYCVGANSAIWDGVRSQTWFQEHYRKVYVHTNAYDTAAPFELYRYMPSSFDIGTFVNLGAQFGTDTQSEATLLRYRLSSSRIMPEEPVFLTLEWVKELQSRREQLSLTLRLVDEQEGRTWFQIANPEPGYLPMNLWGSGSVRDHYRLTLPAEAPEGHYRLELILQRENGSPVPALLSAGEIPNQQDAFVLEELFYPLAVSEDVPRPDIPLKVTFGEHISLLGYDTPTWIVQDVPFRVAFYWHALENPQADYKIFVHLLTPDGSLVAQSDGKPVSWEYPTTEWRAGAYIRDEHTLTLASTVSAGEVFLSVGMYESETGERPPVYDVEGSELLERSVTLESLQVY